MNVIEYNINELKEYENNPRDNSESVDLVANSIREFGFKVPIVVDKDNVIIAGHTRLRAAKKLGLEKVPVIVASDLTDDQVKAFRLADNKVSEFSKWDMEKLTEELADIEINMFDFGFADVKENNSTKSETEVKEDNYTADNIETKAKSGDIYQLGNHRLMCGDSTDVLNLEKLFNNNKIDIVLSDPPYGISVVKSDGKVGADKLAKNGIYMPVKGDETTETTEQFYNTCISYGIDKFILFGGNYFTKFLPFSDSWLIWDKRGDMTSNNFADGEMAWCSFHTPVRIYKQIWSGMIKEGEHEKRVHPTQKPVRMLGDILKDFSKENDNIFDGFGGSGSTLLACEQTNRNCFMIEYEPYYVDAIIDRWEKFTGKKAVLLNGGE